MYIPGFTQLETQKERENCTFVYSFFVPVSDLKTLSEKEYFHDIITLQPYNVPTQFIMLFYHPLQYNFHHFFPYS